MEFRKIISGLALVVILYVSAVYICKFIPGLSALTGGLLLGMIFANMVPLGEKLQPGIVFIEKKGLSLSIVLMAFDISVSKVLGIGWHNGVLIVGVTGCTIALGLLLAKLMRLPRSYGFLLGVGSGICGSAAIMATSPFVHDKRSAGLAVGIVNLIGVVGLGVIPLLVHVFHLDSSAIALLVGGSLQSVGHVVAAGFSFGESIGESAILVKMGRVALLAPLILLLGYRQGRKAGKVGLSSLPMYLYGHAICLALGNLLVFPPWFLSIMHISYETLLGFGLTAIGLGISFRGLFSQGSAGTILASLLFAFQLAVLLLGMST